MNEISNLVKKFLPQLISIRRHLHQYPELSHKAYKTLSYIEEQVNKFGVQAIQKPAKTSSSVTIGPKVDNAIAFRADIDALPIAEKCNHQYRSKNQEVMHACGHDVHTIIVLGLIPILLENQNNLKRSIKLIFQQAEESYPSGAPILIESGVIEHPKIHEIYGIHVWPPLKVGQIGVK